MDCFNLDSLQKLSQHDFSKAHRPAGTCILAHDNILYSLYYNDVIEIIGRDNAIKYRKLWLISACAYSGKRNDSMRLIKDMRLCGI